MKNMCIYVLEIMRSYYTYIQVLNLMLITLLVDYWTHVIPSAFNLCYKFDNL